MAELTIPVGVVVARRRLDNPWVDHAWLPLAVLPAPPPVEPWTVLSDDSRETRYYAGPFDLALYRTDTAQHRENLASPRPSLWVALQRTSRVPEIEVIGVTADPSEGEMWTEAGERIVEPVPMPPEIAADLAAFVETHHVERVFFKRKRDSRTNEGPTESRFRPERPERKGT